MGGTRGFLLDHSFCISTMDKYNSAWYMFMEFILDNDLDMCVDTLCLYIEYLFEKGWKHNTIQCNLTGIAHGLKIRQLPDFTKYYIVSMLMKGVKNLTFAPDVRLPFTEDHLKTIIQIIRKGVKDIFLKHLYVALFSWAFYACLRSSEYTECKYNDHTLQLEDIHRINEKQRGAYRIRFRTFKHSPANFPDLILYQTDDLDSCPVNSMDVYLALRPTTEPNTPLFIDTKGAVSRQTVGQNLKKVLVHMGLSTTRYQLHSFRIGRATAWAQDGYSILQIKSMGRWFSDAFSKYIRPQVIIQ